VYLKLEVRRVSCRRCGTVKREQLAWLADNPLYTKRFAFFVGRRCRSSTIKDVAKETHLHWGTVKELDKQYMHEQLRRTGTPAPAAIGVDEISIRKRHEYRIVVSDLGRRRPIWFGGKDRSETSMDEFYAFLGEQKTQKIRLAVMDMWKPFRTSTERHAPNASIVYDKFHILTHLSDAMDTVRRSEYKRVTGSDRRFIKGQRYNLLRNPDSLTKTGKEALRLLFRANKRLYTAYLLREEFELLWECETDAQARRFFLRWRQALKWKRLKPFEEFAGLMERHWDGIMSYCRSDHSIPLGFVEGLNNKIRVIQRRAYGLKDQEYLRLKILTCMLMAI